jgi:hypothetical protein
MDIVEQLRATPETGADPEMIFEAADVIERLRTLVADLKAWDVEQYMNIPHDLRARMQEELTPNAVAQRGP